MVWEMNRNIFPLKSKKFKSPSSNIKQIKLTDIGVYLELQQLKFSDSINLHSSFEVYLRNSTLVCYLFYLFIFELLFFFIA